MALSPGVGIGVSLAPWWLGGSSTTSSVSPLAKKPVALATIGFAQVAMAWGFTQIFNPRAAYLHVGASSVPAWPGTYSSSSSRVSAPW